MNPKICYAGEVITETLLLAGSTLTGGGLTGLNASSSGLVVSWRLGPTGTWTSLTLTNSGTLGVTSGPAGSFLENNSTYAPGRYQVLIPPQTLTLGSYVELSAYGAANMGPVNMIVAWCPSATNQTYLGANVVTNSDKTGYSGTMTASNISLAPNGTNSNYVLTVGSNSIYTPGTTAAGVVSANAVLLNGGTVPTNLPALSINALGQVASDVVRMQSIPISFTGTTLTLSGTAMQMMASNVAGMATSASQTSILNAIAAMGTTTLGPVLAGGGTISITIGGSTTSLVIPPPYVTVDPPGLAAVAGNAATAAAQATLAVASGGSATIAGIASGYTAGLGLLAAAATYNNTATLPGLISLGAFTAAALAPAVTPATNAANAAASANANALAANIATSGTGPIQTALVGIGGTGAFAVVVPFQDNASNPLQGVLSTLTKNFIPVTGFASNSLGLSTYNLNAGVWTVAAFLSGYSFHGGTITVGSSGTATPQVLIANTTPTPASPSDCAIWFYTVDQAGSIAPGTIVTWKITNPSKPTVVATGTKSSDAVTGLWTLDIAIPTAGSTALDIDTTVQHFAATVSSTDGPSKQIGI